MVKKKQTKEKKVISNSKKDKSSGWIAPVLSFLIPIILFLILLFFGFIYRPSYIDVIFGLIMMLLFPASIIFGIITLFKIKNEEKIKLKIIKGLLAAVGIILSAWIFLSSIL